MNARHEKKRKGRPYLLLLPVIAALAALMAVYYITSPRQDIEQTIPMYYQFDSRWASHPYGEGTVGFDGCGPTCVAMVAAGLQSDDTITPDIVADFAAENGYIADGATLWTFMEEGCEEFGIKSKELPLSESMIRDYLNDGHPIICSVRPGDFTVSGHFIVLTGLDENGDLIINDPNSRENSKKHWDIGRVMDQIKNLWAFSKK